MQFAKQAEATLGQRGQMLGAAVDQSAQLASQSDAYLSNVRAKTAPKDWAGWQKRISDDQERVQKALQSAEQLRQNHWPRAFAVQFAKAGANPYQPKRASFEKAIEQENAKLQRLSDSIADARAYLKTKESTYTVKKYKEHSQFLVQAAAQLTEDRERLNAIKCHGLAAYDKAITGFPEEQQKLKQVAEDAALQSVHQRLQRRGDGGGVSAPSVPNNGANSSQRRAQPPRQAPQSPPQPGQRQEKRGWFSAILHGLLAIVLGIGRFFQWLFGFNRDTGDIKKGTAASYEQQNKAGQRFMSEYESNQSGSKPQYQPIPTHSLDPVSFAPTHGKK